MVPEDLAAQFRERHEKVGKGGVVIVFEGEACGWVDRLRDAGHWRVGAIAVDEAGAKWCAYGSEDAVDDTASVWQRLPDGPIRAPRRGRPASGNAKSAAERKAASRAKAKEEGRVTLSCNVGADVMEAMRKNLEFKDEGQDAFVDRVLRAYLLRKR